ncbi:MAG: DUF4258 domain-containing protein [Gomphosphaeria aponina SAG 52.96 = DSM 107014]|uniref:DUF4258 domain-containing protein n=1 Tax=Gomphosphaeria aponina SAG 52.96 = DSM 107014 TaxID=1521640 RepID=A0A941GRW0_9CHRO|nr:DUF4258 domain-containing protein [Gomphosphaeria aponina SAG 52.96 = DSM 107014]
MRFILSQHAQEELIKRKISIIILELILDHPEQIIEEDGLKVYQGTFTTNNNKTYLLRAYVNDLVEPNKIVTVYCTIKINKYRS